MDNTEKVILEADRKELEVKRARAEKFIQLLGQKVPTQSAWQLVNLDENVQQLEDEYVELNAKKLTMWYSSKNGEPA